MALRGRVTFLRSGEPENLVKGLPEALLAGTTPESSQGPGECSGRGRPGEARIGSELPR